MIDWEHITALKADLGDGFDELVTVFLEEADAAMAGLAPEKPPDAMAADLHFLKGAALNLGFVKFAGLCGDGESAAGRGEQVDLTPIRASYAQSRREFVDGLRSLRAA